MSQYHANIQKPAILTKKKGKNKKQTVSNSSSISNRFQVRTYIHDLCIFMGIEPYHIADDVTNVLVEMAHRNNARTRKIIEGCLIIMHTSDKRRIQMDTLLTADELYKLYHEGTITVFSDFEGNIPPG